MDTGEKLVSTLLVPGGNGAEVLEAIDAAFHDLSAPIGLCVELRRPSPPAASTKTRFARVFALRTHAANLASTEDTPVLARTIRPVHPQGGGSLAGAPRTGAPDPNSIQKGHQVRGVTGLSGRHQNTERPTVPVHQNVNFAGSSPSTDAEPLVVEGPLFSSLAGCFRAPTALRWALTWVLSRAAPSQSIFPSASAFSCRAARISAQTPLRDQRVKRSWQLCHGPYRSGMSRYGAPVFSRQMIPFRTGRWSL